MTGRRVGDDPFTFRKITEVIRRRPEIYANFQQTWTEFSRQLNFNQAEIQNIQLQRELLVRLITFEDLLSRLLRTWVGEMANQATIDVLCIALENSGNGRISQDLQEEFSIAVIRQPQGAAGEVTQNMLRPSASVAPQVRQRPEHRAEAEENPNPGNDNDTDNSRRVESESSYSYIS